MTIRPVNGHLLIEPVKHESFIASQSDTYQEIGVVVAVAVSAKDASNTTRPLQAGDKVYFDSWLAAKYPKEGGDFYWLVKWEDVRAIEHAESK